MRKWLIVAGALVLAAAVAVAIRAVTRSDEQHVALRVFLAKTTATANGHPTSGYVEITNNTGHPVTISNSCNGWIGVGLTNNEVTYQFLNGLVACAGGRLPVGTSRHRISVATTYDACAQHGGSIIMPRCSGANHDMLPPLPPGTYTTSALTQGLPTGIPLPPPITVTLLKPAH